MSNATTTKNDLTNIPKAACSRCGGWTAYGGCSQYANSAVRFLGRTGCHCNNNALRAKLGLQAKLGLALLGKVS
jgi:hypothetical protein